MRFPTSRLDALSAAIGSSALALQKAAAGAAAGETWVHSVRDVADTIMKVGGASALVAGVVFWVLKKLLRPQLEAMIRAWFAPDIRKFQRAIKRATDCADALAEHGENIAQTDEDILLILEAMDDEREDVDELFSMFDRILGIERRTGGDRRDLTFALGVMLDRRKQAARRFAESHPVHASRLAERRRARAGYSTTGEAAEIRRIGDGIRTDDLTDGGNDS